eukprot:jgi/Psemu1/9514/gm1.9514_g
MQYPAGGRETVLGCMQEDLVLLVVAWSFAYYEKNTNKNLKEDHHYSFDEVSATRENSLYAFVHYLETYQIKCNSKGEDITK